MKKIAILESTGLLGIRLERLLMLYGFNNVAVHNKLMNESVKLTFKDSYLIIIDIDTDTVNSLSVIEQIKADPTLSDSKILMISSQLDISKIKKAIAMGCSDFIVKPFNDEILIEKIYKLMDMPYEFKGSATEEEHHESNKHVQLVWQRDYAIGVEEIDSEHKEIIENYRKLYEKMASGEGLKYYNHLLEFLENYVNVHFANEERFQEVINYVNLQEHRERHKEFKEKVYNLIKEHEGKEITNMDLIRINIFLRNWLLHHILVEDAKIGEFIEAQEN